MPIRVIQKVTLPSDHPLIQAADKMQGRIKQAYLDAIESVRGDLTVREISAALERGDAARVMELLNLDERLASALGGSGLQPGIRNVRQALQETFAAGAQAAMQTLPQQIGVDLAFNLMNPEAVKFLDSYTFNLIRETTQQTRDSVQAVIVRAFREGGHPYEQARSIRDMIGLTTTQEVAVANYRSALEDGGASDLRNALGRSLRDGRYDRGLLRAIREEQPVSPERIDAMVDRYRERYLKYRAETIARTESIRASNKGQRELWRQAVEQDLMSDDAQREWQASDDERQCEECGDLDGEERGLDEEFAPSIMEPPDPHTSCLVGETRVLAERVLKVMVRQFDGDVIVIRTARGHRLTCTPNHPILTDCGWVPARFLHKTDDIVCSARQDWAVGSSMNKEHAPPMIQEVASTLLKAANVTASPVPISAEDFHGDGMDGQVAIVYADRLLRNWPGVPDLKQLKKSVLIMAHLAERLVSQSLLQYRCFASSGASYSLVGSLGQPGSIGFAGLSHSKMHRLASAARSDSMSHETTRNAGSSNLEMRSQPFNRPAAGVFLDKIVDRYVRSFSGHVHNLETSTGDYEANGIVTHNCRCTLKLVPSSLRRAA